MEPGPKFGMRHVQVLLMFGCFAIAYGLRVNLSVAIVAMTANATNSKNDFQMFRWSEEIKGSILSSFFLGYLVLQIPAGHFAERYGAKSMIAVGMLVCSITTILTPFAAIYYDYIGVFGTRICQGLAQGCLLPSLNALISKWVHPTERNRAFTVALSGVSVGTLVTYPVSGLLAASKGGWPSVFYVTGVTGVVWVLLWIWIGASSPAKHRSISIAERNYIESALAHTTSKNHKHLKTPWKNILKSGPMYAILISHLGQNWGFWILLMQSPNYINSVLGCDLSSNGFLSALPHFVGVICAYVFSFIAQYIQENKFISRTGQRKLWNSIALFGCGGSLLMLSISSHSSAVYAMTLITIGMGLNSGIFNGFITNHVDLSPNYCGTLMGITNGLANLTSMAGPLFVGFIVTDRKSEIQWRIVFFVSAAVLCLSNVVYILLASAKIQRWNESTIISASSAAVVDQSTNNST